MSKVEPIREGVQPACDVEREMVDYCQGQIAKHVDTFGEPPRTCAIVLESDKGYTTHSWSLNTKTDRTKTCGAAAALLLRRAAED